jgi:TonB-dependent receptor
MILHAAFRRSSSILLLTTAIVAQPCVAADSADGGSIETVVVSGQRMSQVRSIDLKRAAAGIEDVVSSDEIGQLPDKNAAENVERLAGVSLSYDQGEGRYVNIRGVDAALNNVTLNGVGLGSPDSDTRAMPLDVVSGQLVSRIEVVKAVTPDMDAQAIGGSVNLVTQSPYDFQQDFMARGSAEIGYEDLNHKKPLGADASIGGVFGPGNQFGALVGVNYSNRNYRTYGIYPDSWRAESGSDRGLPTLFKATHYELGRERIGGNIAFEYRPTADDKFYIRGLYSDFVEDEHRQRYRIDFATDAMISGGKIVLDSDGVTGSFKGAVRQEDFRHERKRKTIASLSFGGEHRRGLWELSYGGAYVRDKLAEPNQAWTFKGGSVSGAFDMSSLAFAVVPVTDASASDLKFSKYTTQDNFGVDRSWNGQLDLKRNLNWGDGKSYIKAGLKYRTAVKEQDNNGDTYGAGSTKFSLAQFSLQGEDTHADLDEQSYKIAPTIDEDAIAAFTAANIGSTTYFKINSATTLTTDTTGDYHIGEDVLAGYVMANISFGDVAVLGGVRIEHTSTDADGYELTDSATVTPVSSSHAYTNVLPDLHVNWQPMEDVMLRAAYTNTIGRPQYTDLSPSVTISTGNETVAEGNTALKPYKSRNVDMSAEYYPAPDTMVSLGAFYKYVKDPIYSYSEEYATATTYGGITFDNLTYTQPRNAKYATVLGMELSYQQQFDFLPGALAGLGAAANLTLSTSRLHMADRTDHVPFPKQASTLYGVQIFYQKYGVEGNIAYHFGGKYMAATGSSRDQDDWFNGFRRLDAKISYEIAGNVSLYVEGQNLTDEALWEFQGGNKDWVTGYERYGRTVYLGVSAHL